MSNYEETKSNVMTDDEMTDDEFFAEILEQGQMITAFVDTNIELLNTLNKKLDYIMFMLENKE